MLYHHKRSSNIVYTVMLGNASEDRKNVVAAAIADGELKGFLL